MPSGRSGTKVQALRKAEDCRVLLFPVAARRPRCSAFPRMVETMGLFDYPTRRVPDSPDLIELTVLAIALGMPRSGC